MAIQGKGIFGSPRGSLYNITSYKSKGKEIIRTKSSQPIETRSQSQKDSSIKFKNTVSLAKFLIDPVIKVLWNPYHSRMSGFNAFIKENISLFENELPNPASSFILSKGAIGAINPYEISKDGTGEIGCYWSWSAMPKNALADDLVYPVFYNETQNKWAYYRFKPHRRDDGVAGVTSDKNWQIGDRVHAYLSFSRRAGGMCSDTGYYTGLIIEA